MDDRRRTDFQPAAVVERLHRHEVRYVVIGGLAAAMHGSPTVTVDVDVCYARDPANLERLAAALLDAHAELRGAPSGLPFKPDAATLARGDVLTLLTDDGPLDIMATPAGTSGFDDLAANADRVEAFGHAFLIAALDDLIRMKRAAGRPKDRVELEILGALRDEIENPGNDPG
jgi:hypothetical protein